MDFSWLEAVPVGFILFGGTLVAVLRRKVGRRTARAGYPRVAAQLGLKFEEPAHPGELGKLRGDLSGFQVAVLPEQARIVVELPRRSLIDLRNYAHWKRDPPGLQTFSFGVRWADRWMVGRYCHPALAERIHADPRWVEILQPLRAFEKQLRQLTLESERLECVFDYGSPPHIPAGAVRQVLPCLVGLAEHSMLASDHAS